MTNYKFRRFMAGLLCVMTVCFGFSLSVSAAEKNDYQNPETGYKVLIIDDNDLLTDAEEKQLAEDMKPLTVYGNIAFWTTSERTYNEIEQARLKRKALFKFDSGCIFVINMGIRKLTIQSYGTMNESVNDSFARSITDNVSQYATRADYYTCAKTAFDQILAVCEKKHISEPLKVSGYVVISLMLGLITAISIAFSKKHNPLLAHALYEEEIPYRAEGGFTEPVQAEFVGHTTIHRPPVTVSSSHSSGSSCSSCSGGSSCSSCGGGSSCSSCGSGGSSSF